MPSKGKSPQSDMNSGASQQNQQTGRNQSANQNQNTNQTQKKTPSGK